MKWWDWFVIAVLVCIVAAGVYAYIMGPGSTLDFLFPPPPEPTPELGVQGLLMPRAIVAPSGE